jgi:decaprenyl-phosphate phosphoribosyltransferase
MTTTPSAARQTAGQAGLARRAASPAGRLAAVVQSMRPKQWPKNLLVFAAPLAGGTFGPAGGFWLALVAAAAFIAASSAVYLVNDVLDFDRDRQHPIKRNRPIAAGMLPRSNAIAIAVLLGLGSVAAGPLAGAPWLAAIVGAYLAISFWYSAGLKHLPVLELGAVASGFLLRVLGGAVATQVRPSGWFLLVCGLGALMVAIAKRSIEMASLGQRAAAHRPAMRYYTIATLRRGQIAASVIMVICYLLWAGGEPSSAARPWHLASVIALAAALWRFGWLAASGTAKPVEDLIARDPVMIGFEVAWLALFAVGLYAAAR